MNTFEIWQTTYTNLHIDLLVYPPTCLPIHIFTHLQQARKCQLHIPSSSSTISRNCYECKPYGDYKIAETNYNLAYQQLTIRDFDAQGPFEQAKSVNTLYKNQ